MEALPYDITSATDIERFAKLLENKTIRESIPNISLGEGKGNLGQFLEEYYFLYKPNSDKEPDFVEAGVELKTTPLKKLKNGKFSAKERIVFNIINYEDLVKENFDDSSFWRKNQQLLLIIYLYEKEKDILDYLIKYANLWVFPKEDMKIIIDDWEKIKKKVEEGKAHEISESDTLYLAACTKGVTSASTRSQPFSDIPAKQRAFSLKPKYITSTILFDFKKNSEPAIKDLNDFLEKETFEEFIERKFKPYFGMSINSLKKRFNLEFSKNTKQKGYLIAKAILDINKDKIEEFEKADIEIKTINLEKTGTIKESMSFPQIRYKDIIEEEWENSEFYNRISRKFFFVIFRKDDEGTSIEKVMFWNMPEKDLEICKKVWEDTQIKISKGDYDNFVAISDDRIAHVRPKGIDSSDLMETPQGNLEKKKCFWLNSNYIKKQIENN